MRNQRQQQEQRQTLRLRQIPKARQPPKPHPSQNPKWIWRSPTRKTLTWTTTDRWGCFDRAIRSGPVQMAFPFFATGAVPYAPPARAMLALYAISWSPAVSLVQRGFYGQNTRLP